MIRIKKIGTCLLTTIMMLGCGMAFGMHGLKTAPAEASGPVYMIDEDFVEGIDFVPLANTNGIAVSDSVGTVVSDFWCNWDSAGYGYESNNYIWEFDIKEIIPDREFAFHLGGLSQGGSENITLSIFANGQFIRLFSTGSVTSDVYNNSGFEHGGLKADQVDLSVTAHFKIVNYEGGIEVWANGYRIISTHLDSFGNNNYSTRSKITEGHIWGFGITGASNAFEISGLRVSEALPGTQLVVTDNASDNAFMNTETQQSILNYADDFRVSVRFKRTSNEVVDYHPAIRLYGLNASNTRQNGVGYSVNIQTWTRMEGGVVRVKPQLFLANTNGDMSNPRWSDIDFSLTELNQITEYTIVVSGQTLTLYVDGIKHFDFTFDNVNHIKGHLQYIWIDTNNSSTQWVKCTYASLNGGLADLQNKLFAVKDEFAKPRAIASDLTSLDAFVTSFTSLDELSRAYLSGSENIVYYDEALDFLKHWYSSVRVDGSLCEQRDSASSIVAYFNELSVEAKKVVSSAFDVKGYTIGESVDYLNSFILISSNRTLINNNGNNIALIIVLSLGVVVIGGYLFIRLKRKQQ